MITQRSRRIVAAAVVTVISLGVIGGVLMVSTKLGCGPAKALGLKTIGAQCSNPVASRTPGRPTPSPFNSPFPTPQGTESPSAFASPSPTQSESPSPIPSSAVPDTGPASNAYPPFDTGATGAGGNTVPHYGLNCRLPVYVGPAGSGGFIVFPGTNYIADPSSAVTAPTPSPGQPSPAPPQNGGMGPSNGAYSYDPQFSKWLPVGFSQVTPDGSRYAFAATSGIYVVDVASGSLTNIGTGQTWTIVGVEAAGVYAMQPGKLGLWLVPFSGDSKQITPSGFWEAVSADAGYGTPTSAVPQGVSNDIIRVDLQTGAITTWFNRQGTQTSVMGVDASGEAVISVYYFPPYNSNEVWIVGAAGHGLPIMGTNNGQGPSAYGIAVGDTNGVWFTMSFPNYSGGPSNGFALYVPQHGLYLMSSLQAQLAGGCFQP